MIEMIFVFFFITITFVFVGSIDPYFTPLHRPPRGVGEYGNKGNYNPAFYPRKKMYHSSVSIGSELYVFGGYYQEKYYNDMWKFSVEKNMWAWLSGSDTDGSSDSFGSVGEFGKDYTPGSRLGATMWVSEDETSIFIMGGGAFDTTPVSNKYLWEYNVASGEWGYVKDLGAGLAYEHQCVERNHLGTVYVYGGVKITQTFLDGVWEMNDTNYEFVEVKAGGGTGASVHGEKGEFGETFYPRARTQAVSWYNNRTLFVFSGSRGGGEILQDMWGMKVEDGGSALTWGWLAGQDSGADAVDQSPSFALGKYIYDPSNLPNPTQHACSWKSNDNPDELYVFGGSFDGTKAYNDIWVFSIRRNEWMWLYGEGLAMVDSAWQSAYSYDTSTYSGKRALTCVSTKLSNNNDDDGENSKSVVLFYGGGDTNNFPDDNGIWSFEDHYLGMECYKNSSYGEGGCSLPFGRNIITTTDDYGGGGDPQQTEIDGLKDRVSELEAQVTTLEQLVQELVSKTDGHDEELIEVKDRLDVLEVCVEDQCDDSDHRGSSSTSYQSVWKAFVIGQRFVFTILGVLF